MLIASLDTDRFVYLKYKEPSRIDLGKALLGYSYIMNVLVFCFDFAYTTVLSDVGFDHR